MFHLAQSTQCIGDRALEGIANLIKNKRNNSYSDKLAYYRVVREQTTDIMTEQINRYCHYGGNADDNEESTLGDINDGFPFLHARKMAHTNADGSGNAEVDVIEKHRGGEHYLMGGKRFGA